MSPEDILAHLLGDYDLQITDRMDVSYHCGCSRERFAKALAGIGRKDLKEMVRDGKPVEVNCHFCSKKYTFTPEEMQEELVRIWR